MTRFGRHVPSRGLAVGLLSLTLGAASPADAARWLIPASAHADGANGAKFRTDLTIVNPGGSPAEVAITFLPADTDNAEPPAAVSRTVSAAGQLELGDVVDSLFGKGGGGALLVESAAGGLVVASRTYNKLPDRSFGMYLPGLPVDDALPAGETGHLVFLAKSEIYRSNVGFAATTAAAGTATVRLYGGANELLGTATKAVNGFGQTQINDVFGAAGAPATTVARAEVVATVPVYVYATVIDNRTGDPFPLLALRARDAAQELVLTAAAHASGANGSNFLSDLRVFNTEAAAGTLTLALYPRGASTPNPETRTVPLASRQLVALDDVLLTTFGKTGAAGALRLTSDRALFSVSRTYNLAQDGSTSGQELPAVPLSSYIGSADVARLAGISSRDARTNLILFNASNVEIPLALELKGAQGGSRRAALLATEVTLPPQAMTQIDGITGVLGAPAGSTGFLELRSEGEGRYWAIATVIDAGSNDPFQVAPSIQRGTAPGACVTLAEPPRDVAFALRSTDGAGNRSTYVNLWEEYSATGTRVRVSQTGTTVSEYTTVHAHHILDDIVQLERVEHTGTRAGAPFQSIVSYSPAMAWEPAHQACQGFRWEIPSVTQTAAGVSGPTDPGTGTIVSVNERITVPGGTFDTVHYIKTFTTATGPLVQERWRALENGVVVKSTTASAGSVLTQVLVAVATAPVVLVEPRNANATVGQAATFSVTAAGSAPLSYQWHRNGVPIPGATASTYTTPITASPDSGAVFTVVVSNGAGSVTSTAATLAVSNAQSAPRFVYEPVAYVSASPGGSVTLSAQMTGAGTPSWQWRKNGVSIPGATASSGAVHEYTTPALTVADDGAAYSVVCCTTAGCIVSGNAVLTVVSGLVGAANAQASTALAANVPGARTPRVVQVSAGNLHAAALRADGSVWGWGSAANATLTLNRPNTYPVQGAPVQSVDSVDQPFLGAVEVHASFSHTLARREDGSVWTSAVFQDPTGFQPQPSFSVVKHASGQPLTGARSIWAGQANSYAVTGEAGEAWGWGNNTYGQLGDGTKSTRVVPTHPRDAAGSVFGNVRQIAGGGIFTLWLRNDGTVWASGSHTNGQLGIGPAGVSEMLNPVRAETAPGVPLDGVVAIAAGPASSLALRSDGSVWAWGTRSNGGLSIADSASNTRPSVVIDDALRPLTGIVGIAAGDGFSLFLKSDGTVLSVGANNQGQLGDGTTAFSRPRPVFVRHPSGSPLSDVVAISATRAFALALQRDGTVWGWGANSSRQLGDGSTTTRSTPVRVQGLAP